MKRELQEKIAAEVYKSMTWAAHCGPSYDGTVPAWQGGNSLGEEEARRSAQNIIDVLLDTMGLMTWDRSHENYWSSDKGYIIRRYAFPEQTYFQTFAPECDRTAIARRESLEEAQVAASTHSAANIMDIVR